MSEISVITPSETRDEGFSLGLITQSFHGKEIVRWGKKYQLSNTNQYLDCDIHIKLRNYDSLRKLKREFTLVSV